MKNFMVLIFALLVVTALVLPACQSSATTPATTAPATTAKPAATTATTAVPTAAPTTPVQVKTIKFSYTMPKGAAVAGGFEWFGPAFEKATGGRYKVEIYPGSQLIATPAAYDSIVKGAVEMAYTSTATFPKQFPLSLVAQLPSLGFPQNTVKMYDAGNDAFREFVNSTPEIQNEFKDVVLLQPLVLDPYNLVAKKAQIKSPADFKGLKVGGTGPKMFEVTSNGGASVQQVPPDSYLNMDKGVTDAAFITFAQVNDYKIYEIADFYSAQEFGCGTGIILMNPGFYNSMGAADQKILADTWKLAQDESAKSALNDLQVGKAAITKAGKSIYVPTAAEVTVWNTAATPCIQSWRNDAKALGATDAQLDAIFAKWQAMRTKYLPLGQ